MSRADADDPIPSAQSRGRAWIAALGALLAALGVALSAYAAHGLDAAARARIEPAWLFLFLHGVVLCVFAPRQTTRWELAALIAWLLGTVLFCGSLIGAVLANLPTTLVPLVSCPANT